MKITLLKIIALFFFFLVSGLNAGAQINPYPNELSGFEFFGKGKLKGLQLNVSTKDDVKLIFGRKCERRCRYNADWLIRFDYYDDIWIKTSRNEKGDLRRYSLDPKFVGKLRSVEFRPTGSVSFASAKFTNAFERLIATSTIDSRSGKSKMTVNDSYQSVDGLRYEVYSKTNYDDIGGKHTQYAAGDLVLIRYEVPGKLMNDLFVLQK